MYQVDAIARAPKGLTLNNPSQARKGAVWGQATRDPACVPKARALIPSVFEEFKSASLRDAVAHIWAYPTLRFERGCSLRSLPHACAGLLRVCASSTHRRCDTTIFRRRITDGSKGDHRTHKAD